MKRFSSIYYQTYKAYIKEKKKVVDRYFRKYKNCACYLMGVPRYKMLVTEKGLKKDVCQRFKFGILPQVHVPLVWRHGSSSKKSNRTQAKKV